MIKLIFDVLELTSHNPGKKPETNCQGTLDAIRFADDRLGLKEVDKDFKLKAALKKARQKKSFSSTARCCDSGCFQRRRQSPIRQFLEPIFNYAYVEHEKY